MRRLLSFGVLGALLIGTLSACVVREQRAERPSRCENAVWIEGHRGPAGRWHPGHWRCAGVVERVEIE